MGTVALIVAVLLLAHQLRFARKQRVAFKAMKAQAAWEDRNLMRRA